MNRRLNLIAIAAFVVLVGLIFMLSPRNRQRVQAGFLGVIAPFLKQGSSMERKYAAYREGLKKLNELEDESKQLRIANKNLSATNQTLRGLEEENQRLRKALGYRERAAFNLLPARIIARDSSTWYSNAIIDRGEADGVKPDMCVLTDDGLIGKTQTVSERAAVVLLVSDENCKVSTNVEGSPERGIVRGARTSSTATPLLTMGMLSKNANLQANQRVYTAGLTSVFPAGVLVGVVRDFKARELDGIATLVPAVDLANIEDVFVVVGKKKP